MEENNLTSRNHTLVGSFLQYDFLNNFSQTRFFLEGVLYRGDLCTCGDENPFYQANLNYISYGMGMDHKISKRLPLYIDLSFLWYRVLNKSIEDRWAISQYVIGVNYKFY